LLGCGGGGQGVAINSPASSNAANAGGAAVTAVAAGVVWAAGGGCRLQGCPYGSFCDESSGFCEVRRCSQGCPPDTVCNEGLDRCQMRPPASTPNDNLPQDNKVLSPPTVH
jgi:hypothetical protein